MDGVELARQHLGQVRGLALSQAAHDLRLRGKPTSVARLEVLSEVQIGRLATYDRPTWLDEAIVGRFHVQQDTPGFPAELRQALADRGRWLAARGLADVYGQLAAHTHYFPYGEIWLQERPSTPVPYLFSARSTPRIP